MKKTIALASVALLVGTFIRCSLAEEPETPEPSATCRSTITETDFNHELDKVLQANSKVEFLGVEEISGFKEGTYKWVGGVYAPNGKIYAIPTGAGSILEIDPENGRFCLFGNVSTEGFKWTRGVVYSDGNIYGMPRRKNTLLKINPLLQTVEEIDLGLSYKKEHHYGGILAKNGVIYQPPRNTNHILAIDLKTKRTYTFGEELLSKNHRNLYNGAAVHPNGKIYFYPHSGGKVVVLDPDTEKLKFIGDDIAPNTFSCAVAPNGCMYGFSVSVPGVLKIDPVAETAEMICKDIGISGCGDAKLGINGKIYSICATPWERFLSSTR